MTTFNYIFAGFFITSESFRIVSLSIYLSGADFLHQNHLTVTMDTSNNFVLIHGKNISHNTMGAASATPHMSIDKLFPALLECFGIIMCGYIAGRCGSVR